jgi:predicted Rdx family selenoprotein
MKRLGYKDDDYKTDGAEYIRNMRLNSGMPNPANFKVAIVFAVNYTDEATSFAAGLFKHYENDNISVELIPGMGCTFEIIVNNKVIYSGVDDSSKPDLKGIIARMDKMKS